TIKVTSDGTRKLRYGSASWVYGEELAQRDAMWWSSNSKFMAFYKFDESKVKDFYLTMDQTEVYTKLDTEGYPKAGQPNPLANLLIYNMDTQRTVTVDCGNDPNQYLFDIKFRPDNSELLFRRTDRQQKRLEIVAANVNTGITRIVHTETQDTWQEPRATFRFLKDNERFIWKTEKTGFAHYDLRNIDGTFICALTAGQYPIKDIVKIDEKNDWLYYSAFSDDNPLNLHLHRVHLDGTGQKRLTPPGKNYSGFNISPDNEHFIALSQTVTSPPQTALYNTAGEIVSVLAHATAKDIKSLSKLPFPEIFSFKAADGRTDLYGLLFKPNNFKWYRKYPLIIDVYGGPDSNPRVRNVFQRYRSDLDNGAAIAIFDGRGTNFRGKAFQSAGYMRLGDIDISDQAAGVKHLSKRRYIDPDRVGIYGVSYGRYMSVIAVLKHPDVFKAACAVAAVTDWYNYDTAYTERYMNTPQNNPEGYKNGSCMNFVDQLTGHLMIMHGIIDNNVHPNNAWQLIDALDKADKPYQSRFFPTKGHAFPKQGQQTMWEFFREHLN
ncbi:MAG: DPP IV N-terminal domain-containing protein, partial [Anaerohalosphaera sp.]|nr:DPP IV N-terminal domain-containing protein [Anaerohalosphaera sp.]